MCYRSTMLLRVLALGSPKETDFARSAVGHLAEVVTVASQARLDACILGEGAAAPPEIAPEDCIFLAPPGEHAARPIVVELGNNAALRYAIELVVERRRGREVIALLASGISHDARGALGVMRLALQLVDAENPAVKKIENGMMRLEYLVERLPEQCALELGQSAPERLLGASSFETVAHYVEYIRRVQSRRTIEFKSSEFTTSTASLKWVPLLAGLSEFALKLAPARSSLTISAVAPTSADPGRLLVEADRAPLGPELVQALGGRETWTATEVLDAGRHLPHRLREAAWLALKDNLEFQVRLESTRLFGEVRFP
jgi:hypothetical protein